MRSGILPLTGAKYLFPGFDVGDANELAPGLDVAIATRAWVLTLVPHIPQLVWRAVFSRHNILEFSLRGKETIK